MAVPVTILLPIDVRLNGVYIVFFFHSVNPMEFNNKNIYNLSILSDLSELIVTALRHVYFTVTL